MPQRTDFDAQRRRVLRGLVAASAALGGVSPWELQAATRAADPRRTYSAKVVDIVQRALVIDMLAPLKIDFNPDAFSFPLTDAEADMFRTSGITAFHNSVGVGGPEAYAEALQFIAAW